MPLNRFREFIRLESKSSFLLLFAAFLAILMSNSPWSSAYQAFIAYPLLQRFINEGLMTLFFFLIGLEIKRGVLVGELNSRKKFSLPFLASVGGMLMAALVYFAINGTQGPTARGWAIPTATDIAFSSAVLLLLGRGVPRGLRLLLTTLAIIDDLIAAAIIALFYSNDFQIFYFLLALVALLALFLLSRKSLSHYLVYLGLGFLVWFFIMKANMSPAISGVLISFALPLEMEKLESRLHPWVSYGILPLFAFVNAGFSFSELRLSQLIHPLTLGIIGGLFMGKQLGVFSASWLAVKTKLAKLPEGISFYQLYGMAVLCGIGFTMNLFIGFLAFEGNPEYLASVKFGILCASLLSAIVGYTILRVLRKTA